MDINDRRATKYARSCFIKRGIDLQMADVRVQHGVCFVRGCIQAAAKVSMKSVEHEAYLVTQIIRRSPDIKECVLECTYKEQWFN